MRGETVEGQERIKGKIKYKREKRRNKESEEDELREDYFFRPWASVCLLDMTF